MKRMAILLAAIGVMTLGQARADGLTSSAQQVLKDGGFYYGDVTGQKDADTTAAIRRYQIRNGLKITGELNAETLKSLGLNGGGPAPAPARPAAPRPLTPAPPQPAPRASAPDDGSDLTDDDFRDDAPVPDDRAYPRGPVGPGNGANFPGLAPRPGSVFAGTPYERAPAAVQRRVIAGAQVLLLRQGLYRSGIDGMYGPGTELALRAYQARIGFAPTGRLDLETLGSLGLLPGRERRGLGWPRALAGERIYTPR